MVRMLFIMIPFADDAERQVKNECARQQYRAYNVERAALHLVRQGVWIFGSRVKTDNSFLITGRSSYLHVHVCGRSLASRIGVESFPIRTVPGILGTNTNSCTSYRYR